MTNTFIAQMKLADTVKLHYSRDNNCAHVIQAGKATVAMTNGTAHLTDIFIGKHIHHTIVQ